MSAWRTPQEQAAADWALAGDARDVARRVATVAEQQPEHAAELKSLMHECLKLAEALEQRAREMTK